METKLNYEVTSEEAYVSAFSLSVDFMCNGELYYATCIYVNEGWLEDVQVFDKTCIELVEDEDILHIGQEALENMNINKDTITW
jgi:hypothetical protein